MEILNPQGEVLDVTYHRKETQYYTSDVAYWFQVDGEFIGVVEHQDETTTIVDGQYSTIDTGTPENQHLGQLINFVTQEMRDE